MKAPTTTIQLDPVLLRYQIDAILDICLPITTDEALALALASLNSATASLIAFYSTSDEFGLQAIGDQNAKVLELYRENRKSMSDGRSPIGRNQ